MGVPIGVFTLHPNHFSGFPAHPHHAPISTPANSVYLFRHRTFCPILSRRAGGCSVAFGAFLLRPQFTSTPRIVGGSQKGQCKCCAENYSTRSRWPGSNRHRPQFCFRAALPLSYSGICAAGRKRQSPAAIGMEVCGHERTRKPIIILVASPFGAIWHHFCLKSVLRLRFMYFSPDYWLDQPYNQEIHQNDRLY